MTGSDPTWTPCPDCAARIKQCHRRLKEVEIQLKKGVAEALGLPDPPPRQKVADMLMELDRQTRHIRHFSQAYAGLLARCQEEGPCSPEFAEQEAEYAAVFLQQLRNVLKIHPPETLLVAPQPSNIDEALMEQIRPSLDSFKQREESRRGKVDLTVPIRRGLMFRLYMKVEDVEEWMEQVIEDALKQ